LFSLCKIVRAIDKFKHYDIDWAWCTHAEKKCANTLASEPKGEHSSYTTEDLKMES